MTGSLHHFNRVLGEARELFEQKLSVLKGCKLGTFAQKQFNERRSSSTTLTLKKPSTSLRSSLILTSEKTGSGTMSCQRMPESS